MIVLDQLHATKQKKSYQDFPARQTFQQQRQWDQFKGNISDVDGWFINQKLKRASVCGGEQGKKLNLFTNLLSMK